MNIQPVVEGHGEVAALPVLLRRFIALAGYPEGLDVGYPIRRHRNEFFDEDGVRRAVKLARKQDDCAAILLLFDGDAKDDCPLTQGPEILRWARQEAGTIPVVVVMAYREYEAWFLASIESLRGLRGIREDATSHPQPEEPRGAKGQLEERMEAERSYHETADQPALTAAFDLARTYRTCRSFRHLATAFGELVSSLGLALNPWPPPEWAAESAPVADRD